MECSYAQHINIKFQNFLQNSRKFTFMLASFRGLALARAEGEARRSRAASQRRARPLYREEAPGRFLKLQKVYSTYSTRVQIYFYSYSIELSIFLSI